MPLPFALVLLCVAVAQERPAGLIPGRRLGAGLELGEARRRVRAGQYRLGLAAAEAHLRRDPEDLRARSLRAEALGGLRRCAAAGPELAALRPTPAWTARLAVLEGECALERGELSAAEVAFAEALHMHPDAIGALHGRARGSALLQDAARVDAMEALRAHEDAGSRGEVIEAQVSVELGLEELDAALAALLREAEGSPTLQTRQNALVADGIRWLDLGDPAVAEARFGEAAPLLPGRVQAAVLRAEALRRLGQPQGSQLILEQPRVVGQALPLKGAVWVRVLVDLGRMEEARAAMDVLGTDASPDALASAWYLAQAEGRAAAAADLARRWRALAPNADRDLVQLRPISETP